MNTTDWTTKTKTELITEIYNRGARIVALNRKIDEKIWEKTKLWGHASLPLDDELRPCDLDIIRKKSVTTGNPMQKEFELLLDYVDGVMENRNRKLL